MRKIWAIITFGIILSGALSGHPVAASESSCDEFRVVSGNNRFAPSTVTFAVKATGSVQSYRFYFGDGQRAESASAQTTHKYDTSGSFTSRVDIKDATGAWKSSPGCQAIFSLLPSPLESQKSGCGDVFVTGGNNAAVGTDVKFLVTGFDNKSGIKEYKIDFGNGQVKQSNVGNFNLTFSSPGTYVVKGFIKDSKNNELGGTGSCQTPLYITGAPIASQPATGTPTLFTLVGILSGICLFFIAQKYSHR